MCVCVCVCCECKDPLLLLPINMCTQPYPNNCAPTKADHSDKVIAFLEMLYREPFPKAFRYLLDSVASCMHSQCAYGSTYAPCSLKEPKTV